MKPSIEVNNISKSYIINHKDRASYKTIKDDFSNFLSSPLRKNTEESEKFWALKDISFNIMPGEIFGIVGRNGSGKSTLLKILSRVVDPTEGRVKLNGKVASLLEVGTGFHPELTGRENIFFNGSMLGMSRKEIQSKFDEIVSFSEVEKFIDTPVKFYSSGMYVRLAFSIAAHLDPDILILDEVLAVGDANFQKKSLDKIKSIMGSNGTTVLFVSHSMSAVQQLCSRGILLDGGNIVFEGNVEELTLKYLDSVNKTGLDEAGHYKWQNDGSETKKLFTPLSITIIDSLKNEVTNKLKPSEKYSIKITFDLHENDKRINLGYCLRNAETKAVIYLTLTTDTEEGLWPKLSVGNNTILSNLPMEFLNGGEYTLSLIASIHNQSWIYDQDEKAPSISFRVDDILSRSRYWKGTRSGYVAPQIKWLKEKK
jgi:lipopolysaccharide transport system ATP-binding protein